MFRDPESRFYWIIFEEKSIYYEIATGTNKRNRGKGSLP